MPANLNRREFLKLAAASLGGLAFSPYFPPQEGDGQSSGEIGRVTTSSISVFKEPRVDAKQVAYRFLDEILNIYYPVIPETGPIWNPRWYRVFGGYVHSSYIQRVTINYNIPPQSWEKDHHQLAEVTVPFTQLHKLKGTHWEPINKIYYQTVHWAVGLDEGPDGEPWIRLYDEAAETTYNAPAAHLRLIPDEEIAPISPDVPPHDKWIEISRARQRLTAYEVDKVVMETTVSTGILDPGGPPEGRNTPPGRWNIYSKMPTKHMGNINLTGAPGVYELLGVPWTMFFHKLETGVAMHGAYWHDNYGNPMSQGCVNMRPEEVKWLFRWTTPVWPPPDWRWWERTGYGTEVIVE
jgi:lipoprotein-anchoring transpeptidase ErfK/SrfK